jgi:hypothetical protein
MKMHLDSLDYYIELRDIVDDRPDNSENIFFIDVENIDAADSVKLLNIRQLCSIESAGMGTASSKMNKKYLISYKKCDNQR